MRASYPQSPNKRHRNGGGTGGVEEEKFQTQDSKEAKRGEQKLLLTYTEEFHKDKELKRTSEGKLTMDDDLMSRRGKSELEKNGTEEREAGKGEGRQGKKGLRMIRGRAIRGAKGSKRGDTEGTT